jgi:hypothetical protein
VVHTKKTFRYYSVVLAIVCVAVFVLQLSYEGFTDAFVLLSSDVFSRPWILLTSVFLHGGLEHLVYNMFALVMFGLILEKLIGSRRFLIVFFLSGLFSGSVSSLFYRASLGASGAIFGIIGVLAVLRPKMVVWVYSVPMPMFLAAGIWAAIDLFGLFYPSQVASAAHLAGLVLGLMLGLYWRRTFKEEKHEKEESVNDYEIDQWEEEWM